MFVLCARLKHPFDFSSSARHGDLCRLDRLAFWVAGFEGLWLSVGSSSTCPWMTERCTGSKRGIVRVWRVMSVHVEALCRSGGRHSIHFDRDTTMQHMPCRAPFRRFLSRRGRPTPPSRHLVMTWLLSLGVATFCVLVNALTSAG